MIEPRLDDAGVDRAASRLELLGRLAPGIAHEINTPAQYLNDYAHFVRDVWRDILPLLELLETVLRTGALTPSAAEELAEAVARADLEYLRQEVPSVLEQSFEGVRRIAAIARAMSDFAVGDGEAATSVDLNNLIAGVLTVGRNEVKYVADVETDLDPSLPRIGCYGGEIRVALLETLIRAARIVDAATVNGMPRKGRITVRTRTTQQAVEITVSGSAPAEGGRGLFPAADETCSPDPIENDCRRRLGAVEDIVVSRHGGTIRVADGVAGESSVVIGLPLTVTTHSS